MKLIHGDTLDEMAKLPNNSIDMILADLPYGTTANKWDVIVPFDELWNQYERIIKENGAIILFGSQPFTTKLIASNMKLFRYEWIYRKVVGSNFALAHKIPLKEHENILVFYKKQPTYNPIKEPRAKSGKSRINAGFKTNSDKGNEGLSKMKRNNTQAEYDPNLKFPSSVQIFNNRAKGARGLHPAQKPLELLEYLIKTYTNENEIILDNTMGSGSTGVAAIRTNRDFIGIEIEQEYFDIATDRINSERVEL
ncbi:site-specific DNA-methyltransferase [Weissella coleopterorum]|uniref:Methyltransferase n=1 Tax=Weissella coleopterorum TaxID=2714949 RepID=A0A6G8AY38_9LACO|nr:site-specific DNA-methyltransferase [Weissella coleopterorum]QIL49879.1 site-specific DNA-methyltransferase [Weissella coleopterorum]